MPGGKGDKVGQNQFNVANSWTAGEEPTCNCKDITGNGPGNHHPLCNAVAPKPVDHSRVTIAGHQARVWKRPNPHRCDAVEVDGKFFYVASEGDVRGPHERLYGDYSTPMDEPLPASAVAKIAAMLEPQTFPEAVIESLKDATETPTATQSIADGSVTFNYTDAEYWSDPQRWADRAEVLRQKGVNTHPLRIIDTLAALCDAMAKGADGCR